MLFLFSFVIFNDDLKKEFLFVKGILLGIFFGIVFYIIFYIGVFIIKVMLGGLENFVEVVFNKYLMYFLIIWLLFIVVIIFGEEIFWCGFVLKWLNYYFNFWFLNVFVVLLCMVMMFLSGNFVVIIGIFVVLFVWNIMYFYCLSLFMLYLLYLIFVFLLFVVLLIY